MTDQGSMNIEYNDIEKLTCLLDAQRAGLERLCAELQQLNQELEAQGLTTGPHRTAFGRWDKRPFTATRRSPVLG